MLLRSPLVVAADAFRIWLLLLVVALILSSQCEAMPVTSATTPPDTQRSTVADAHPSDPTAYGFSFLFEDVNPVVSVDAESNDADMTDFLLQEGVAYRFRAIVVSPRIGPFTRFVHRTLLRRTDPLPFPLELRLRSLVLGGKGISNGRFVTLPMQLDPGYDEDGFGMRLPTADDRLQWEWRGRVKMRFVHAQDRTLLNSRLFIGMQLHLMGMGAASRLERTIAVWAPTLRVQVSSKTASRKSRSTSSSRTMHSLSPQTSAAEDSPFLHQSSSSSSSGSASPQHRMEQSSTSMSPTPEEQSSTSSTISSLSSPSLESEDVQEPQCWKECKTLGQLLRLVQQLDSGDSRVPLSVAEKQARMQASTVADTGANHSSDHDHHHLQNQNHQNSNNHQNNHKKKQGRRGRSSSTASSTSFRFQDPTTMSDDHRCDQQEITEILAEFRQLYNRGMINAEELEKRMPQIRSLLYRKLRRVMAVLVMGGALGCTQVAFAWYLYGKGRLDGTIFDEVGTFLGGRRDWW